MKPSFKINYETNPLKDIRMIRISILFFAVLTTLVVPGCLAVGPFSSESLQNGENIVIKGETFNEDLDITEMLEFHPSVPGVMKAVVKGNVVFEKCNFYKFRSFNKKDGKNYIIEFRGDVVFDKCLFRDSVDFSYMVVNGDFHAASSEFMGPATFNNAWFKGRNNTFSNAVFYNKALFNNTMFENRTRFFKAKFEDAAMFQSAVFKGHSFWGAALFEGYAGFGKTIFRDELDMSEASFRDRTNFNRMICLLMARFTNTEFQQAADFSGTEFYLNPDFRDARFDAESSGVKEYSAE